MLRPGWIIFPSNSGALFALDAPLGTEVWRLPPDGIYTDYPVIADGSEIWQLSLYDWITPWAVRDGVIYATGDDDILAIGGRASRRGTGGFARITEEAWLRGGPAQTAVQRPKLAPETFVKIAEESVITNDVIWWPGVVTETGEQGCVEALQLAPTTSG